MQFKEIKIADLKEFLNSELYLHSKNIPITKQRALSQFANPRADKDAIALFIAINNDNKIIGFIGALPEKIPNISAKLTWNSCWWIDPNNGKQVALPLFLKFLKNWNNLVMFRDLTDKTEQIIFRLNRFKKVKKLTGYKYFLRLKTAEILINRNKNFNYIKPVLQFVDFIFNKGFSLKNKSFLRPKNILFTANKIDKIDEESEKFILQNNKNELFKRSKKELNWILKQPWICSKSHKKPNQFYYFSDVSAVFKNYVYKIYSDKTLVAVLFLTNNNGLVKVPYAYFLNGKESVVLAFLYQFLLQEKATSFFVINPKLQTAIEQNENPFWYKKVIQKDFVVSKKLAALLPEKFTFQDGEGDFVFT